MSDHMALNEVGLSQDDRPGVGPVEKVRLDQLAAMQCAIVCSVDEGDDSAKQLMAMGVCIGRRIEVIKCGDPLILRVLGSRLGVSARLAQRVLVDNVCSVDQCHSL